MIVLSALAFASLASIAQAQPPLLAHTKAAVYNDELYLLKQVETGKYHILRSNLLDPSGAPPTVVSTEGVGMCSFDSDLPQVVCLKHNKNPANQQDPVLGRIISLPSGQIKDDPNVKPPVPYSSGSPNSKQIMQLGLE